MVSRGQDRYADPSLLSHLGEPSKAEVHALPGHQLTPSLPLYLVDAVRLPLFRDRQLSAKLVDFGESFHSNDPPKAIRTPLTFRAPELLLGSNWDSSIDIWALACTIFELVTGQPPFDNLMPDKGRLIQEWMATFGGLPAEWRQHTPTEATSDLESMSITDWLHDCYFDQDRRPDYAEEHLEWLGDLLTKMMRWKPKDRLSAQEVLQHKWFAQNPVPQLG